MSEWIEALVLGIVQGLTEFLPVSSSGHIEIAKSLLNDDSLSQQSMLVTVLLHFGTALATAVVFRKDILKIITYAFRSEGKEQRSFVFFILVSMIPAVFVGLFFEDLIESLFNRNLILVASMLLITGLLLLFADKETKAEKPLNYFKAGIIGIAQAVAILPGISRSGATISTALILGVERETAARFSFLMVIPLIFGKMFKDLLSGEMMNDMPSMTYMLTGFSASFLVGILACIWMLNIVKKAKLKYFAFYCFAVAIFIFGYKFFL